MKTVTKKELVQTISDKMQCSQQLAGTMVQCTLDTILEALAEHGRIELRNFGIFEVKERKPHQGLNPKTGERVQVERHFAITFTPGKLAGELVNDQFQSRELRDLD